MLKGDVLFPSSPNWYLSHVVDAVPDGAVALATNQTITLLDAQTRRIVGIRGCPGRVTGVGLGNGVVCACVGNRTVYSWHLATLEALASHREHRAEPTALVLVNDQCVTGDKRGGLCIWPFTSGRGPEQLTLQKEAIHCICPQLDFIAVGYISGTVVVMNLKTRRAVCSVRHQATVQSISWDGSERLVTACKDNSVQVWILGSDKSEAEESSQQRTICERVMVAPVQGDGQDSRSWTAVYANEGTVFYGGSRGELFVWSDRGRGAENNKKAAKAAQVHSRPIFGICPVGSGHLITVGMDRVVVLWALGKEIPTMQWRLCCLGGHVTAVRTDGASMAVFGCGDGQLRIMDLMHKEHRQHCWVVWKGLMSSVTSVCPAPGHKVWAYGLQDGNFGILPINDTDGPGLVESLSTTNHTGPVTSLCWIRVASVARPAADIDVRPEQSICTEAKDISGGASDNLMTNSISASKDDTGKTDKKEMLAQTDADGLVVPCPKEAVNQSRPPAKKESTKKKKNGKMDADGTTKVPAPAQTDDQEAKSKKEEAKKKKSGKKDGNEKDKLPIGLPDCLLLVSISVGCQGVVTGAGHANSKLPSSAALPLRSLAGMPARPLCAAAWPSAIEEDYHCDALVVFSSHGRDASSMQILRPVSELPYVACLSILQVEGLTSMVTVMANLPISNSGERICRVLVGTSTGTVGVICLVWPLAEEATLRLEVMQLQAHSKEVGDVQWCPRQDEGMRFLSTGSDGVTLLWLLDKDSKLQCLSNFRGLISQSPSSAILAACWDCSEGSNKSAVLLGGRDQLGIRWTPEIGETPSNIDAITLEAEVDLSAPVDQVEHVEALPDVSIEQATGVTLEQGASKSSTASKKNKAATTMLSLASAALHQSSSHRRALELLHLMPHAKQLWPFDKANATTLGELVFDNRQVCADQWVALEIAEKLRLSEVRQAMLHKARLLQLWLGDVVDAATMGDSPLLGTGPLAEESGSADGSLPSSWLWLALSAGRDDRMWESLAGQIVSEPKRSPETLHPAVAVLLEAEQVEAAVHLYHQAGLWADALLLARLRLPSSHPMITFLYSMGAKEFERKSRHDQAAKCYLAAGMQVEAMKALQECVSAAQPTSKSPIRQIQMLCQACVTEATLTKHFQSGVTPFREILDSQDLACKKDLWWNQKELQDGVRIWQQCIVEAVEVHQYEFAFTLARLDVGEKNVSSGIRFLRSALAGYAVALAWWTALQNDKTQPSVSGRKCSPLASFVALRACTMVRMAKVDFIEGSWLVQDQAVFSLPFYEPRNPMLTAVVEVGRACASMAGKEMQENQVSWQHLLLALDALMFVIQPREDEEDVKPSPEILQVAKALMDVASLAPQQFTSSPGTLSSGENDCRISPVAVLAATGTAEMASKTAMSQPNTEPALSDDLVTWTSVSRALFGFSMNGRNSCEADRMVRSGYFVLSMIRPAALPKAVISQALKASEAGISSGKTRQELYLDLVEELRLQIEECGWAKSCALSDRQKEMEEEEACASLEGLLQWIWQLHERCTSPLAISLTIAAWCVRQPLEPQDPGSEVSQDWTELLRGLGRFILDAGEHRPEAEDERVLQQSLWLQKLPCLAWAARLRVVGHGLMVYAKHAAERKDADASTIGAMVEIFESLTSHVEKK